MTEQDRSNALARKALPGEWDQGPFNLADELRQMLKSVVDQGTSVDCGSGNGFADLWPVIEGVAFHVRVTRCK
jgi:hypothetical protein